MSKPCYFLAPTRDCPPDGPIVIGNIVDRVSEPEQPINGNAPPAFSGNNKLWQKVDGNWKREDSKSKARNASFFTSFSQALGIGSDASIFHERTDGATYEAEKLTTVYFNPTRQYIQKSIEDEDVRAWMMQNSNEPMWMITGIKVASGAKFYTENTRKRGLFLQVGIDMTPMGIPVSFGPKVDLSNTKGTSESAETTSDFVLAYRLREIRYSRKDGVTSKDYTKGALYDTDSDIGQVQQTEASLGFFTEGFADYDVADSDILGLRKIEVESEDGIVTDCVTPEGFYT
ncbi:hypothetical protein C1H76_0269 [Elsinoe australis]|uniref:Uncharacterized protein n=1 Tax=Elsinoe australis TaxID=40998 RepID=A0A4V6DV97_9PEZI|nr:hypothetical protein C1H76_0269 [Elsinoe australis]